MSRKIKKIKKRISDIHYKSFNETLQVIAILKCLECTCCYYETLRISDVRLVINAVQQKIQLVEGYIDDLSLI
ncbi:MAG: hypothetical protein PHC64_03240 [Candidatus Gastranaerophilales bacterium]|nr:hypothetical protein [Candidatus Gastranaerophilales bacterium]